MANRIWILSSVCAAFIGAGLMAQQNPPATQPGNAAIADLPAIRGVYYHTPDGWVALQSTLFMPYGVSGGTAAFFGLARGHAYAEIPGSHADLQIGNDARPTFYVRGITPVQLYLVRAISKPYYRELRLPMSDDFQVWAHFRSQDVADVDIEPVAPDVVSVKPRADLKPGEYTLAPVIAPSDLWLRLSYGFGVASASSRR